MERNEEKFSIDVAANTKGPGVVITIDGEEQQADGFQFAAPLGTGLAVRKVVLVELVPAPWDRDRDRL